MPDLDKKPSSDWREHSARDGKKYVSCKFVTYKLGNLSLLYILVLSGHSGTSCIYRNISQT